MIYIHAYKKYLFIFLESCVSHSTSNIYTQTWTIPFYDSSELEK